MKVLHEMLTIFRNGNHRVLLFTQTRTFAAYLCDYLSGQGLSHLLMTGSTPVKRRLPLVDQFQDDPSIFAFVLTTRVGGLGFNLQAATRVVIVSPDWNPKIDQQSKERSWRMGQTKEVEIYRMICAGTIEERILHRQIFKNYLISRILSNPAQRRFFSKTDLACLFSPYVASDGDTDTGKLFKEAVVEPKAVKEVESSSPKEEGEQTEEEGVLPEEETVCEEDQNHDFDFVVEESAALHADPVSTSINRPFVSDDQDLASFLCLSGSITSAINHDYVENGYNDDANTFDSKAEEIAKEAVLELRKSGQLRGNLPVFIPTYTGSNGEAGKTRNGGMKYALKQFKDRAEAAAKMASESNLVKLVGHKRRATDFSASGLALLRSLKKEFPSFLMTSSRVTSRLIELSQKRLYRN
ncbi:hypothetical protein GEMRC1_003713 [Eukaryota sp. GEM-RC1]